jgi:hypothetical protein
MTRRILACAALVLALPLGVLGGDSTGKQTATPRNANFEKLKKLAGTWLVVDSEGKATDQVASVIKVTAGGSVVHETIFPGQPHEMISVYYVDGSDLIMTHYCVLGNQPRLKADPKSATNQIAFEFAGGSNLDSTKDRHMHSAVLTIVDDNHIELNGVGWNAGGPAKDMCCGQKLVRKN